MALSVFFSSRRARGSAVLVLAQAQHPVPRRLASHREIAAMPRGSRTHHILTDFRPRPLTLEHQTLPSASSPPPIPTLDFSAVLLRFRHGQQVCYLSPPIVHADRLNNLGPPIATRRPSRLTTPFWTPSRIMVESFSPMRSRMAHISPPSTR